MDIELLNKILGFEDLQSDKGFPLQLILSLKIYYE